jgi:hypothetical protein
VSLRIPNPFLPTTTPRSFFLLETSGSLVVQRGYMVDTGAFPDEASLAALDEKIDQCFEGTYTGVMRYFIGTKAATADGVREFADWLLEYFSSAEQSQ